MCPATGVTRDERSVQVTLKNIFFAFFLELFEKLRIFAND